MAQQYRGMWTGYQRSFHSKAGIFLLVSMSRAAVESGQPLIQCLSQISPSSKLIMYLQCRVKDRYSFNFI